MSAIWLEPSDQEETWRRIDIAPTGGCFIGRDSIVPLPPRGGSIAPGTYATIARDPAGDNWYVLARPSAGLRVNGDPLTTGLMQLRHKDLITGVDMDLRVWFSEEVLTSVVTHAGETVRCPRCRTMIEPGHEKVVCQYCKASVHQRADRLCWTYTDACPNCGASTGFQTEYTFPEEACNG